VLPLRLLIVISLFGVALWGLFSLLENLREPELLRSAQAVVVKGCDSLETAEARAACPTLFCEKAVLDRRMAPLNARFEITFDEGNEALRVIGGLSRTPSSTQSAAFACVLKRNQLTAVQSVSESELRALTLESAAWLVEAEAAPQ
jgi:hypothetical protein